MRRSLYLITALALSACGDEDEVLQTPTPMPTQAPRAATPTQAAVPIEPQAPTSVYSPVGKRDPFTSYLTELQESAERERQRKLEATEQFELDQYKLTGVITGTSQPKALVEDPEGKGHGLHVGSRLGKRGGVVTRITPTGIMITEEFRAPTGEKIRVPITVKLPQPELEMAPSP